jgi:Family of unknown function (DUF5362)
MDPFQENNLLQFNINEETKTHLNGIAQWSNIYALLSFVNLGLGLVTTIYSLFLLSKYDSYATGISNLIGFLFSAFISLLLNITLFTAAKNIKAGIDDNEQSQFNIGIRKLNSFFKIMGILFIIFMVIIVLAIFIGIIAGAFGLFNNLR